MKIATVCHACYNHGTVAPPSVCRKHSINAAGDSIASPGGNNVKQYVFFENEFGISKRLMHPYSSDAVNGIIAYRLGKLLGWPCPAIKPRRSYYARTARGRDAGQSNERNPRR